MIRRQLRTSETISDELVESIGRRLSQGKGITGELPLAGRLHIERPLPFLCVYRQPVKHRDEGTAQLVLSEASHLVVSGDTRLRATLPALVRTITKALADKFHTVLIIEIWATSGSGNGVAASLGPAFRIITSKVRPPTATIEALERALAAIKIAKLESTVEVVYSKRRSPPGLPLLLPSTEARKLNYFVIGLEIAPIYRDPGTGQVYPVLLRNLHRGLARALRQAFFEFARTQTTHRPPNYHALGQRALVKTVWEVDRQLAEIGSAYDFLLQVTPVNLEQAWLQFRQSHFEQAPALYYRPLPVDPGLLKRRLYQIPLERVEDPTLAYLFRQKRNETDRELTMLADRGSRRFLFGSLQIFGEVSNSLKRLAETLLAEIPPRSRESSGGRRVSAAEFAQRARAELDYYRRFYPGLSAEVYLRDDTVGLMVSRGNLLIGREAEIPEARVEPLLQHEVGTHVLTYFNGRAQPFQQLYTGLAGYEELQEGLAVLAEYLVGGLSRPRLRLLAGRVIAAHCLIEGASFVETYRELHHHYRFEQRTAFVVTVRIYRGGGLTKDAVYLRGLVGVLNYLKQGGELEPLFVGKIAADHVPIIHELHARRVLRLAPLRPRYMERPETAERLAYLRQGVSVLDLINLKLRKKG